MIQRNFEQFFAFHCAPTLAGIKAANLISIPKKKFDDFTALFRTYEPCLRCKGVFLATLSESPHYKVVLLYRRRALIEMLDDSRNMAMLKSIGYHASNSPEEQLAYLNVRMRLKKTFPHEIGLFLGYPYEDVAGFMADGGKKCKVSGYWKVYTNIEAAERIFARYSECSQTFCESLMRGESFAELVAAS